jgi:hypothetical protein
VVDEAGGVEPQTQPPEHPVDRAVGPPAAEAVVDALPVAVALGQVAPLGSTGEVSRGCR